jgi:hypothetical protein
MQYLKINQSFTELGPSWEAANCIATQELPSILWNPKVHYPPGQRLGLPGGLFPSALPPIPFMHSYSLPFVLHALPISSSFISSF